MITTDLGVLLWRPEWLAESRRRSHRQASPSRRADRARGSSSPSVATSESSLPTCATSQGIELDPRRVLRHAVAAAGRRFGFETVGVIRGEEHLPLNPVLNFAISQGMQLRYMDRTTYRNKRDPAVIERLEHELPPCYILPEGGSDCLALKGCAELVEEIEAPFILICCPCGTGGTLAGIALGFSGL